MMGDNRDNSNDSRFWGPLPMDLVKGRAMFLYWSWDRRPTLATVEPHLPADSLSAPSRAAVDEAARGASTSTCRSVPRAARTATSRAAPISPQRARALRAGPRARVRAARGDARGRRSRSVFFGGGTPSALPPRHFRRACGALPSRHFTIATDAEITLEANPESVREARLEAWARGRSQPLVDGRAELPVRTSSSGSVASARAASDRRRALALARRFASGVCRSISCSASRHTRSRAGARRSIASSRSTPSTCRPTASSRSRGRRWATPCATVRALLPDEDAQAAALRARHRALRRRGARVLRDVELLPSRRRGATTTSSTGCAVRTSASDRPRTASSAAVATATTTRSRAGRRRSSAASRPRPSRPCPTTSRRRARR